MRPTVIKSSWKKNRASSHSCFVASAADRWLEVFDDQTNSWFPADPAVGVVSNKERIAARMGFKDRPQSPGLGSCFSCLFRYLRLALPAASAGSVTPDWSKPFERDVS
jgi:hypothetical protein